MTEQPGIRSLAVHIPGDVAEAFDRMAATLAIQEAGTNAAGLMARLVAAMASLKPGELMRSHAPRGETIAELEVSPEARADLSRLAAELGIGEAEAAARILAIAARAGVPAALKAINTGRRKE